MDQKTIHQLNQLNAEFYNQTGEHFDSARRYARKGWYRLLGHVQAHATGAKPYRVLDIGCGNGQFGRFLFERLSAPLFYHGIDSNTFLLDRARQAVPRTASTFSQIDLVFDFKAFERIPADYHFIVLNNVMHHLPSFDLRRRVLAVCAGKLRCEGLLVFTLWQFMTKPKWQARVVPWRERPSIDPAQLEPNDYLLDWRRGTRAVRYCHFTNARELDALLDGLAGLAVVETFLSDGKSDDLNRYVILQTTSEGI